MDSIPDTSLIHTISPEVLSLPIGGTLLHSLTGVGDKNARAFIRNTHSGSEVGVGVNICGTTVSVKHKIDPRDYTIGEKYELVFKVNGLEKVFPFEVSHAPAVQEGTSRRASNVLFFPIHPNPRAYL